MLENCKLLYNDTDSLVYEIRTDDVYKELILSNIDKFDPQNNIYNILQANKKVPG